MEGHGMFFPHEQIENEWDEDKRDDIIRDILNNASPDDPPFLSNILVHADENWAVHLMEVLSSGDYQFTWRIQSLRNEWGEQLKPGQSVVREIPINRVKRDGDLVTPRVLSRAKKDGSYDRRYERKKEFKLDSKCCFECKYGDAVYFLNNWGYNKKTNTAVTKKPEYSYEPADLRDPSKGMKKHVRYWRYAEMDKDDYAKLPDQNQKNQK
jgi:hypothetical protein